MLDKPVDLSYTKSELKERETAYNSPAIAGSASKGGPKYPWGLTLRLDQDSLKKLGIDDDLPEVGELCQINGVGRIISVSQRENVGSESKDVEIQIERMNLAVDEEDAEKDFAKGASKGRGRAGY